MMHVTILSRMCRIIPAICILGVACARYSLESVLAAVLLVFLLPDPGLGH